MRRSTVAIIDSTKVWDGSLIPRPKFSPATTLGKAAPGCPWASAAEAWIEVQVTK